MTEIDEVISFSREYINNRYARTPERKEKIRIASKNLFGTSLPFSCGTCYLEAIFKIIKSSKMASRYELKKGVLLQAFGHPEKACTNNTITDELAEWYLTNYPEKAVFFAKIPPREPVKVVYVPPKAEPKPVAPNTFEAMVNQLTDTPVAKKPSKAKK
jgi:hypothetical protein